LVTKDKFEVLISIKGAFMSTVKDKGRVGLGEDLRLRFGENETTDKTTIGKERPKIDSWGDKFSEEKVEDDFGVGFAWNINRLSITAREIKKAPQITPKLQKQFSKFLSRYDLSKNQHHRIKIGGGLRVEISIDNRRQDPIMVWVFKDDVDGSLATLLADKGGNLTSITDAGLSVSNLTRESVALAYEKARNLPMREALIEAFHIPQVTEEMRQREARADIARKAYQERLATVMPTKARDRSVRSDTPKAIEVLQHEFAITRPGKGRSPLLQTFGAGPCVVMTLHDKQTKVGVMAHFDATTTVATSFNMIKVKLEKYGVDIGNMEMRLVGGQTGQSEELILSLRDQADERGIDIVEQEIVLSRSNISAVMLDTETGELYDYDESIHNRIDEAEILPMSIVSLGLHPLNFHRSKKGLK